MQNLVSSLSHISYLQRKTFGKRKRDVENTVEYDPEEEYEYKQTREYTWSVKNKSTRGYDQNYFFVLRDGCFFYNELETRVRLTKRRNKTGIKTTAKLLVKHRELTDNELNSQLIREYALKPSTEVEEEEADIEPRDEESQEDNNVEGQSPAARTSTEEDGNARKRSTSSSSSSGSSSSSESSSESEDEDKEEAKRVAEEIFGSDDDDSS